MCQGFFLLGDRIPTLQLPLSALRRLGWTFRPHFNSSFDISGIGQYSVFYTHPESLHFHACLSFFFLICPFLSSLWDPLIPPDLARCYRLWSYHPDLPGPSSFLLHFSSLCRLLTPPCWSLPHLSLCCFPFCRHACLSSPSPLLPHLDWKLLEGRQWALFIFVYPVVVSTAQKTKSMCEMKECKPICFPG